MHNIAPPNLLLEPSDYALFNSMNITLSCKFQGTPLPAVTWMYLQPNGTTPVVLLTDEKYSIRNDIESGEVYTNITSFLTLTSVGIEDVGLYTCSADNGIQNRIRAQTNATSQLFFQQTGTIHVLYNYVAMSHHSNSCGSDPILVEQPASQVAMAGSSISLNCAAASNSVLNIIWTRNGQVVSLPGLIETGVGLLRHNLLFPNLVVSDTGSYMCTAVSSFLMRNVSSMPAYLDVFGELLNIYSWRNKVNLSTCSSCDDSRLT